jgi:HEAT repeat protein
MGARGRDASTADQAWSILHDGMVDKSSDQRAKAVHALGLLDKDRRAEEMAEKSLADENADVRTASATSLGQIGLESSRRKLRDALNDKDIKVVLAAANALYALKDPAAYEVYYAILTGQRKGTEGLIQSQLDVLRSRKGIEKMAFEAGLGFVPYGGMGYEAWKTISQNGDVAVRADSAAKLARDPDPKSGQALAESCLDSKWQIRVAVIDAIAKRGDPGLLYAVIPLMQDNSDTVRYQAAAAVLHLIYRPDRRYRFGGSAQR